MEIQKIPMTPQGFMDVSRRALWHAEAPFLRTNEDEIHAFNDRMRQGGAKTVLSGMWGDQVLFDLAYLIDLFDRFNWAQTFNHLDEYPSWMTDVNPAYFNRGNFF